MSIINMFNTSDFVDNDGVDDSADANVAISVFSVMIGSLCSLIVLVTLMRGTPHVPDEEVETGARRREKRQQRKEFILENMTVTEWHPINDIHVAGSVTTAGSDEHSVVSTITDNEDHLPSEPASVQGPVSEIADESSVDTPTSCPMGTDDTDECASPKTMLEDGPECAICLCGFEDHDKICESSKISCKHVFHKNCMMGWLMKHEECPMCREVWLKSTI